jgi:carbonic anhydrase
MRGQKFDLEVQLEHKASDGSMAIISVMMRKGFGNFGLNTVIAKMPKADTTEPTIIDGVFFSPQTLFPADLSYYTYTGSLTTPPCTENVQWYVLKSYVELGADQLSALKKALGNNARAIQPPNNRKILQN